MVFGGDPYAYKELTVTPSRPVEIRKGLFDFGKDGIGWLELEGEPVGEYDLVLGEMTNSQAHVVNPFPESTIRAYRVQGRMTESGHCVRVPKDHLNTTGWDPAAPPVRMPDRFPVATAFRYVEIISSGRPLKAENLVRKMIHYPIDMNQSSFECDNAVLNEIYGFCRYSILATSFCGYYVDGDRERTQYEGDAYINQLCQYAMDADYSLARKSHERLMEYPTWPTEWKQHSIKMAWADWMWTGDNRSLAKYYEKLQRKLRGCYPRRDIVDWPKCERDGFDMRESNAVVEAFHVRNLAEMSAIAAALGKKNDADDYARRFEEEKAVFLRDFYNPKTGLFVDAKGSSHSSLHANAAAVAFDLVPPEKVARIIDFLEGKGMACSVYFSQYLLEAFCIAGRADIAVRLMSSPCERGWKAMIDFGSTVTMEAWSVKVKPNLDLNHAWGAVPLNIISRYILGVTPLEPGFARISVRPALGGLSRVKGVVPTARGPVEIDATASRLHISLPAPARVVWNGTAKDVPPGEHVF